MSSEEWKEYSYEEIANRIYSGGTPSTTVPEYWGGNIKWLSSGETKNRFVWDTENRITEKGVKESSTRLAQEGDTVLASAGQGKTRGQVSFLETNTYINQSIIAINPKTEIVDPMWIFYDLNYRYEELRQLSDSSSIRGSLNITTLKQMKLMVPPIETQKKIINILKEIDDKIELNRQMNATLEAMAQAIFKEWFVDFNFPGATGEMVKSELGLIPKGWKVGRLGEVVDVIDCLHSKKPERVFEKTGYILLQLWNILDSGLLDLSDIYWISEENYVTWISRIEAVEGVIVITNVGRVGAIARIPRGVKAALGRNMTGLKAKNDFPFDVFLILLLKSEGMRNEIAFNTDAGTILDSLNVRNIPHLKFVYPPRELVARFELVTRNIWELMENQLKETYTLAQIRDTVLPRLMSGEIITHSGR